MAIFKGTIQEFHHFVGPKIRNSINVFTKKHRKERNGICEICQKTSELQSAHIHGRDRRTLVESILVKYLDKDGLVNCTLEEVETAILDAHKPIENTFKFICHPCHVEYDSKLQSATSKSGNHQTRQPDTPDFTKLSRIKLWSQRPNQINSQIVRSFLALEVNKDVTFSELKKYCEQKYSIEEFESHFASMKTDKGNSHGAVFYEQGEKVKMWGKVRNEVQLYF